MDCLLLRTVRCGLAWPFRAVEGVACSVATMWPWISLTVTSYNLQHTVYTPVCTFIYNANHNSHPLVLDCPHSKRTLYTLIRKLHTLMRKCPLPQHPHNSPLRPASPRLLCRAIPRQSLASPGDATSSPSSWLRLALTTTRNRALGSSVTSGIELTHLKAVYEYHL